MTKTITEKRLEKFRNQFHALLQKYPDIMLSSNQYGDVCVISVEEGFRTRVYLPKRASQQPLQ